MTDKEVTRFKVKYPKVNLSKARLDGIKLLLADDADDAAIDARLDEVNGNFSFEDMAKHDDRQRQPPKPDPAPQPKPADPAPADAPDDKDTPAWAKGFMTQITTLANEVASLKAGKVGETRQQKLEAALADAPEAFKVRELKAFGRMKFDTDGDFDSYLEEVKTDGGVAKQEAANTSISSVKPPVAAKADASKQASKEELDSVMSNIL